MSNEYLFHNVDVVIYLEGGDVSFTFEQVKDGECSIDTLDTIFWGKIFEAFMPNKKMKFKSIGSKTIILQIANGITTNAISNVYVGMDNEFDELLEQRIDHQNVFYSYGYSWENDIWNSESLIKIIETYTAIVPKNMDLANAYNLFLQEIRECVIADFHLFKLGGDSFFDRQKRLFCIECDPKRVNYLPSVRKDVIYNRLSTKGVSAEIINQYNEISIDAQKYCYGHLLADYCAQLLVHYAKKKYGMPTPCKDILNRMAIQLCFNQSIINNEIIYRHYKAQFDRHLN